MSRQIKIQWLFCNVKRPSHLYGIKFNGGLSKVLSTNCIRIDSLTYYTKLLLSCKCDLIERFKPFAAGCPLEGVEVKIDSPGPNKDGEICLRGRNVFMGYLYNEDKTKESIDEEGWLHTGDIGSVDGDSEFLKNVV